MKRKEKKEKVVYWTLLWKRNHERRYMKKFRELER
jgi:hypothetical protein